MRIRATWLFGVLYLAGCSGDDETGAGGAGSGGAAAGAAGNGGASGAGNAGSGGAAGSAGAGATAGDAGTGAGGTAAAGGTAGSAGGGGTGGWSIPDTHPRVYLNAAQRARLSAALAADQPSAKRVRDIVNGELAGNDYYAYEGWHSALLYVLLGDTTYADDAIARTDAWVTAEEALIAAGERAEVAADSYLYVGEHIGNLALVYDWCFDRLSDTQKQRWLDYASHAVWNVWHPNEATWGTGSYPWSGWSVDDPSNNYWYSFVRATMLLGLASYGESPDAAGWVDMARTIKIEQQLVPAFTSDLEGGGSREGTGYGIAMRSLFLLYDFWEQTTGERIADLTPHTKASLRWLTHSIVPTLDRLAPIGDHSRDSTASLFDYHRDYLLELGSLYPGDDYAKASRSLLAASSVPVAGQAFEAFGDFLYDPIGLDTAPLATLATEYHGAGTGLFAARSAWSTDASWMSLQAGPYTQSHAHQDQGSLLVYAGEWLAYDANIDSHSGIHAEVKAHNLVRFENAGNVVAMTNGPGATLEALQLDGDVVYLAADATTAYGSSSQVIQAERRIVWRKPDVWVVLDRVASSDSGAVAIFTLNSPIQPTQNGSRVRVDASATSLELWPLTPASPQIDIVSWPSEDSDYNGGWRVDVSASSATTTFASVLSLNDAVTGVATLAGATGDGVSVTLAGGDVLEVDFHSGADAHVDVKQGATTTYSHDFPASVATLPELAP